MKLNIIDKSIIITLVFLITGAIISLYKQHQQNKLPRLNIEPLYSVEYNIPAYAKTISKKYNIHPELFSSDKPTFVYSYNTNIINKNYDKNFHKHLKEKYEKAKLNYRYLAYKNWKEFDDSKILLSKQKQQPKCKNACFEEEKELGDTKEIKRIVEIANNCIKNICVIEMKKSKYTIISRDEDFIINKLKNNNTK